MKQLFVLVVLSGVLLCESAASANVTGISVTSLRDLGTFAGKPYREAALRVDGTARGGPYRVPAVMAYPARTRDANGLALVEPYNTAAIWIPGFPGEVRPLDEARMILGDDYLFGQGNVYLAVLWDKAVIEARGEGFLAAGTDASQVLRDAAALVRHPGAMPYPPRLGRRPRSGESWPRATRGRRTCCATSTCTARTHARAAPSTARCSPAPARPA